MVDDASTPAAVLPEPGAEGCPLAALIRLDTMLERAVARNTAARAARGELVLFSDDDLICGRDFLAAHLRAHETWPGALVTGEIVLPPERLNEPGVWFRQAMERGALANQRAAPCQRRTSGPRPTCRSVATITSSSAGSTP